MTARFEVGKTYHEHRQNPAFLIRIVNRDAGRIYFDRCDVDGTVRMANCSKKIATTSDDCEFILGWNFGQYFYPCDVMEVQ